MKTQVKICGLTNVADALAAAEAGADLIGLMFYEQSPRHLTLAAAANISRALQEVDAAYVPSSNFNPPLLAGAGAEIFFDIVIRLDGLGAFADEINNCVDISLGRILASKIAANRAKDKLTIPVLRDALAATRSVKRR